MSYCPKCGSKIEEDMSFCPKCGAPLKAERPPQPTPAPPPTHRRGEKAEKYERGEKREKAEKGEKREKRQYGFFGPLIAGLVLLLIGLISFLRVMFPGQSELLGATFFIVIGVIVVIGAVIGVIMASRRHPKT